MQPMGFSKSVIIRFEEDLTLLFEPRTGAAFKTDGVGTLICRGIAEGRTPNELVEEVRAMYDVNTDSALRDTLEFIHTLQERGFLQAGNAVGI